MKKASTLISAIIAIVVLLAALGVGFSVKQFRVHRAEKTARANPAPEESKPVVNSALPRRDERRPSGEFSPDQRIERPEDRPRMTETVDNMGGDERRESMDRQGDRFGAGGRREGREGMGGGRRPGGFGMSEEERQAMRERIENMTEEERREYFEQMRQRFGGGRRRGDRSAGPGGGADGGFRRRDGGEEMRESRPDRPTEN
ncbi:MAG: hypothetical protein ACYS8Z_10675 [Planctomycetota bacterium]|jgi:hypothetical protein